MARMRFDSRVAAVRMLDVDCFILSNKLYIS